MKTHPIAIARHRNGVAGAPFEVVLFDEIVKRRPVERSLKLAVLFDQPGHCAVLEVSKLVTGDIRFGSNSWRGDDYEPHLRAAIKTDATEKGNAQ